MTWLVKLLGIDRARAAFARLARVVNAFADEAEEGFARLRGRPGPPALEQKKTKEAEG